MAKIKQKDIIKAVEEMTMLEVSELVSALEEKFGVSASAPVAIAAASSSSEEEKEEKSSFNVELTSFELAKKIAIIKIVRDMIGVGLKEAKDTVESAPVILKENINKEDSEKYKKELEKAGATITLK